MIGQTTLPGLMSFMTRNDDRIKSHVVCFVLFVVNDDVTVHNNVKFIIMHSNLSTH